MLIGVISDTHGDLHATQAAVRLLESLEVESVIHCGDIGSASIVQQFHPWPTHFVLGNVDDHSVLPDVIDRSGQTCHGRLGSLVLEGKKIAFLHGDDGRLLRRTIESDAWDLVCHGHTHRAEVANRGATLVLNPGALARTARPSFAAVRLPSLEVMPVRLH
jgi:putative phosphoesterase